MLRDCSFTMFLDDSLISAFEIFKVVSELHNLPLKKTGNEKI